MSAPDGSGHSSCLRGGLIINKPKGLTSFDVIRRLRSILGKKTRMGHAGTLDPAASGVLLILLEEATRVQHLLSSLDKEYLAEVRLGIRTDTLDAEGEIVEQCRVPPIEGTRIEEVLLKLTGERMQHPPQYSALKVNGRRAYRMARAGERFELEPRKVTIHSIKLETWRAPAISIRTRVSSGTYIRSLAAEIGEELGLLACLDSLTRTRVGRFGLGQALDLDNIEISAIRESMIPIERLLEHVPHIEVDEVSCRRLLQGKPLAEGFDPTVLASSHCLAFSADHRQAFLCVPREGKLRSKRLIYDDRGADG